MRYIVFIILNLWVNLLMGQSILNESVTLNYSNAKVRMVFNDIQQQTGAVFSYSDFKDEQRISIKVSKRSLKDVIEIIETELSITITTKEKYLIVKNSEKLEAKDVEILGKIIDPMSDEPLSNASVFVTKHKILVNTRDDGKFSFKVPSQSKSVLIHIAKENYLDTSLIIVVSKTQNLHIKMRSYPRQKIMEFDSLTKKELILSSVKEHEKLSLPEFRPLTYNETFWNNQKKKNVNLININDTLINSFSISLLPPISTNRLLSYHTRNTLSINVIGGHSKGLNGVEVGGVYNYDDGDVFGLQAAGVLNLVSENVVGAQIGGVFNGVLGHFKGVQVAGLANINDKSTTGVQISGLYQSTKTLNGLQVAGLYNKAKSMHGGQISGLVNVVDSASSYMQIAGLYNQAANVKGIQISGLVNSCDTLQGLQIGIINKVNHIKSGLSIGLFNYVKNGYNKLELSYNELGTATLGYRSGWAPLHMHYFGGVNLHDKDHRYTQLGGGLATSLPISNTLRFEADANVRNSQILDNLSKWDFNMYNQLMAGISWQPMKKLGIRTGISINHLWYDPNSTLQNHIASSPKNNVYTNTNGNYHHKMWIGWQLGIVLL